MASLVERAVAMPFRAGTALRGARVFHPEGFLCRGTWEIDERSPVAPEAAALQPGARYDVTARVSRGPASRRRCPTSSGSPCASSTPTGPAATRTC